MKVRYQNNYTSNLTIISYPLRGLKSVLVTAHRLKSVLVTAHRFKETDEDREYTGKLLINYLGYLKYKDFDWRLTANTKNYVGDVILLSHFVEIGMYGVI